jgi:hypothetical protein
MASHKGSNSGPSWSLAAVNLTTAVTALLDRLLNHAQAVAIEGESYRSTKRK